MIAVPKDMPIAAKRMFSVVFLFTHAFGKSVWIVKIFFTYEYTAANARSAPVIMIQYPTGFSSASL